MGLAEWKQKFQAKKSVDFEIGSQIIKVDRITTGSFVMDYVLGGGLGKGIINELAGDNSGGKTTCAIMTGANVQAKEQSVIWIDTESRLDEDYANALGLDTSSDSPYWLYAHLNDAKQIEAMIRSLYHSKEITNLGLIVIDSTTGINPPGVDGEAVTDDNRPALIARFWSKFASSLASFAKRKDFACLFISQVRENIDMSGTPAARNMPRYSKVKVTGGNALNHYKSLSVFLQPSTKLSVKKTDVLLGQENIKHIVGKKVQLNTLKNSVTNDLTIGKQNQYRQAFATIIDGKGFDNYKDCISMFIHHDYVNKSGAWYSFKDSKGKEVKVQGDGSLYDALKEHPDLCNEWMGEIGFKFKYF